ncbi:hypothetical protein HYH03_001695 [Edaphochlamys debaryana]|uniref:Uncharacterized protein n=1 Tax=Edaphochlamys debaryana TaxID=47281 RepID=A0A836C5K0_9CHLO|nr:hypothetical protein HYH03_001695 [Edaphochlamys debaryana]|eukprot:KAG2500113.1 hypothetical protein HYH03_001695 [Edaphochlamys debaryana]
MDPLAHLSTLPGSHGDLSGDQSVMRAMYNSFSDDSDDSGADGGEVPPLDANDFTDSRPSGNPNASAAVTPGAETGGPSAPPPVDTHAPAAAPPPVGARPLRLAGLEGLISSVAAAAAVAAVAAIWGSGSVPALQQAPSAAVNAPPQPQPQPQLPGLPAQEPPPQAPPPALSPAQQIFHALAKRLGLVPAPRPRPPRALLADVKALLLTAAAHDVTALPADAPLHASCPGPEAVPVHGHSACLALGGTAGSNANMGGYMSGTIPALGEEDGVAVASVGGERCGTCSKTWSKASCGAAGHVRHRVVHYLLVYRDRPDDDPSPALKQFQGGGGAVSRWWVRSAAVMLWHLRPADPAKRRGSGGGADASGAGGGGGAGGGSGGGGAGGGGEGAGSSGKIRRRK